MKEFSTRQLKIGEELKHTLSSLFMRRDIYDPATLNVVEVTISEVQISPDLKNATVFFQSLGGKDQLKIEKLLNQMNKTIRGKISKMMKLRHTPNLYFKTDASFDKAKKLNDILATTKD